MFSVCAAGRHRHARPDKTLGEEYGKVQQSITSHAQLASAELQTLESVTPKLLASLLRDWKLPALLAMPMSHHHDSTGIPIRSSAACR
jgi:HD-like signal output (HDOD) protein